MSYARGIEHIGMTVPSIAAAERFFQDAFNAEILYRGMPLGTPPMPGDKLCEVNGLPRENAQLAISMLRIGTGANLELFQVAQPIGDAPNMASLGATHFSVFVDDMNVAQRAVTSAGGTMLDGPQECSGPESGPGNQIWFCRTPWGSLIELVHLPSPMKYEPNATTTRYLPEGA